MSERRATVLRIVAIVAVAIAVGLAIGAVLGKYGDHMGISGSMRAVLIVIFATTVGRTFWVLMGHRAQADRRPDRRVGESQHGR